MVLELDLGDSAFLLTYGPFPRSLRARCFSRLGASAWINEIRKAGQCAEPLVRIRFKADREPYPRPPWFVFAFFTLRRRTDANK